MNDHQSLPARPVSAANRAERFFDAIRAGGVYRRRDHRWIGGVCSGIATRLNIDPVLVRIAAVLAGLFFGVGITVYLLAWALLPDDAGSIHAERAWRERHPGSVILVVITALSVLNIGDRNDRGGGTGLFAVLVAGGLWYLLTRSTTAQRVAGLGTGGAAADRPVPEPLASRDPQPHPYPQDRLPGEPLWTPPKPAYAAPAAQAAPRRRTGGPFALLLALGLSLLVYHGTQALLPADQSTAQLLGMTAVVIVLALMVVVLGLAGRRGGLLSLITPLLAIGVAAASFGGSSLGVDLDAGMGERTWRPTTVADLQGTYEWAFGDAVLDLSALDATAVAGKTTKVRLGMGQLKVIVPENAPVTMNASVRGGQLGWEDDAGERLRDDGSRVSRTLDFEGRTTTPPAAAKPLTVDATVTYGELTVEQR